MTLQRRLLLLLLIGAPAIWAIAVGYALWSAQHEINELFDTQQVRLAQQVAALLPSAQLNGAPKPLPPAAALGATGASELDQLSVAVWNAGGEMMLSDREGVELPQNAQTEGFVDVTLRGHAWRVYYLNLSVEGERFRIGVGQAAKERSELLRGLLASQLVPWLMMLPVLLAVLAAAVRRGLQPMRAIAQQVRLRRADSLAPLAVADAPAELQPLLTAMNDLFKRIDHALEHERQLTANAAHELRTPLAALRAHWETAQLAGDEAGRKHAYAQIGIGIDRLSHLVSQLLALAAIERRGTPVFTAAVDWRRVFEHALSDCLPLLESTGSEVTVHWPAEGKAALPLLGEEALLTPLVRNLIDNAVRYAPPRSQVTVRFSAQALTIEDEGPGLNEEQRRRLGDRFYRPAGQTQSGSGLGISIAQRVAALHGLELRFDNRTNHRGLQVTVARASAALAAPLNDVASEASFAQ